jgi:peptidylprolyl isomerase domain and WD repeat-containing protein 1
MAASENTVIKESEETDPTLFCTAYKKNRFYAFSRREPDSSSTAMSRDIYNEKPTRDDQKSAAPVVKEVVGQSCIIHTTFGDIYLRLFPEIAPKAVENFIGLAEEGLYIFNQIIIITLSGIDV